jgi:MHS family metabolite:H+ symporter-like MFS transporter
MDFQLYSLGAALVFHEIFFLNNPQRWRLFLRWGHTVQAISPYCRCVYFRQNGRQYWSQKVLFITITMMGICTTLLAYCQPMRSWHICPGVAGDVTYYSGAGCRCGNFRGGDHAGGICAKRKRGIISSLVAMGTNCGTLSATAIWAVMFFALDRRTARAWGWRIPFLASVVVMIFAIWLRMNLKESPVFES